MGFLCILTVSPIVFFVSLRALLFKYKIMDNNKLKNPAYLFEVSWEVCNKVGGIHTVISTKALNMVKEYSNLSLIHI